MLAAVLERARGFARDARDGSMQPVLVGMHIGLVCKTEHDADARLFIEAACALGAKVSHVRPSLTEASADTEVAETARLLGRLYDAVEFQGAAPSLVARIAGSAGIPVFDGIASSSGLAALLAGDLQAGLSTHEARRCVVQALLHGLLA